MVKFKYIGKYEEEVAKLIGKKKIKLYNFTTGPRKGSTVTETEVIKELQKKAGSPFFKVDRADNCVWLTDMRDKNPKAIHYTSDQGDILKNIKSGQTKTANLSSMGFKNSMTFISDARKFITKPKNLTSAQVKPIKIQEKSVTDILNKAQI